MIVAGIDVGAKNVHAVLIEDGRVVAKAAVASGFDHEESAERGLAEAARVAGRRTGRHRGHRRDRRRTQGPALRRSAAHRGSGRWPGRRGPAARAPAPSSTWAPTKPGPSG